jgi:hypothetical protein
VKTSSLRPSITTRHYTKSSSAWLWFVVNTKQNRQGFPTPIIDLESYQSDIRYHINNYHITLINTIVPIVIFSIVALADHFGRLFSYRKLYIHSVNQYSLSSIARMCVRSDCQCVEGLNSLFKKIWWNFSIELTLDHLTSQFSVRWGFDSFFNRRRSNMRRIHWNGLPACHQLSIHFE